jgi:group I intron endonuclease
MKNINNNDKNPTNSYLVENYLDNKNLKYVKIYEDAYKMRKDILRENKGKGGIYMLTNKLTNDIYIGQSIDISNRFKNYFNISYIKSKNSFKISKALIKYGYSNFSLTILEYCDKDDLLVKEQYYFDKLNPEYNILKIAGSSKYFKHSEETKAKISKSLKRIYLNEKSALFGCYDTEQTKELVRQKALGRIHSENTKLKMSITHGNPLNIYEKCSSEEFKLIGGFVSARKAGKFLEISGSTVIKYMNSGKIFKDRYKFSSK